ncbi:hypothetical protein ACFCVO_11370 [Agromyces sp. NPDC056379]|uniref:hypothetical protein n=1 Tax=unclassified Agromyces TaxID=2639701 RepID=UPI0035D85CD1
MMRRTLGRGASTVGHLAALLGASATALGLAIVLGCLVLAPSVGILGGIASRLLP